MDIQISIDPKYKEEFKKLSKEFVESINRGLRKATLDLEARSKKNFGKPGHLKVRTGKLRQSIYSKFGFLKSSVSSDMVYAAIHQYGGDIKAKNITMPKRPFIIPEEDRINKIIGMQLEKDLKNV